MKQQWMFLAMAGGMAAITLAIAPLSGMADPGDGGGRGWRGEGRGMGIERLNLTEAQQVELQQIRTAHQDEVAEILTEEQRAAFRSGIEAGEPMPAILRSLNLTQEQRDNLHALRETHLQQGREILTPDQQAQLEAGRERRGDRRARGMEFLEDLDLTDAQRAQLDQIRENGRQEMAAVLTADQREAFQAGIASGEPMPRVLRSLNLSDDQRNDLWSIMEDGMAEARNVLTPEQQAEIDELRESWRGRHGGMGRERGDR